MEEMKDMLVLIPGIMGSVLQHNGNDLWAVSGQSLWGFITSLGGNIQKLKLQNDDHSIDDLGDNIVSSSLMPDTVIVPGFWKIDGYTRISQMIRKKFNVVKGELNSTSPANYYEFHYDWRRDNRVAARRLKNLIERQLPIWRNHVNDQSAKVVLIGHSMGGLISRHYIEVDGGWKDCRMLITFGTPFRGSCNALSYLVNGYKNWLVDFTEVLRSLTSVYQLLPVYKCISVDGSPEYISELINLPNIDQARARKAREFHLAIKNAQETNQTDPGYEKNFELLPIVGNNQPTLQSGRLSSDNAGNPKLEVTDQLPDPNLPPDGDGTVPFTSSVPLEVDVAGVRPFIEQHGSLQNNDQVLNQVYILLKNLRSDIALTQAFGPGQEVSGISLKLEDLYFTHEPVTMSAKLIDPIIFPKTLKATIQALDRNETYSGVFQPGFGKWELVLDPLPEGRYRVRVESSELDAQVSPVSGLFEVAKP